MEKLNATVLREFVEKILISEVYAQGERGRRIKLFIILSVHLILNRQGSNPKKPIKRRKSV